MNPEDWTKIWLAIRRLPSQNQTDPEFVAGWVKLNFAEHITIPDSITERICQIIAYEKELQILESGGRGCK